MCEEVAADNAQLASKAGIELPEWTFDLGLARAYRGDDKPAVEKGFDLMHHGYVHLYSKGVSKGPKQRAKRNPVKDACISVATFTHELIDWVVKVANHRPYPKDRHLDPEFLKTRKAPTPFNYWTWSIGNRGGPPKKYIAALMMPRLLKREMATMTAYGLHLKGAYFDLPDDDEFQRAKALTTHDGTLPVEVHYDEITARQIYLVPKDQSTIPTVVPIAHISREHRNKSFAEIALGDLYRACLTKGAQDAHDDRSSDPLQPSPSRI
jgi:hypothetical protein